MSLLTEMAPEKTCAIIKPDAVQKGHYDEIISRIQKEHFHIVCLKKFVMSRELAEKFYTVHRGKLFFDELVEFMTSGPVIVLMLEKVNAITDWRGLMGATDPKVADSCTIRSIYGTTVGQNAVHGSDSSETARIELELFFPELIDSDETFP